MENPVLIAILTKLVDEKISKLQLMPGPRGPRGHNVIGKDGKDFNFQEYEEEIKNFAKEFALKFDDFTSEQIDKLKGPRGIDGRDGRGFIFSEHEEAIKKFCEENSLKFEDLTQEQIESLKGPRGEDGKDGKGFIFSEHEEAIKKFCEEKSLKFEDLTPEQIQSLRGQRGTEGRPGKDGKGFVFSEHEEDIRKFCEEVSLKFEDLTPDQIGLLRGPKGADGRSGKDGKDFVFSEHEENIRKFCEQVALKFEDLTPDQIGLLRGPQGRDGRDGKDGKDFILSEHEDILKQWTKEFALKFEDFDSEQIEKIRGPRGRDGKEGRDFDFGEHRESIENILRTTVHEMQESLRLKFSDLSTDDINQLRGPRGRDGRDGRDFVFEDHREFFESLRLKFADLTEEEKHSLKLHFADLSDEEKSSLKLRFQDLTQDDLSVIRGPRGSRGQRGAPGRDGKDGQSIRGLPGVPGRDGKNAIAIDGKNGQDGFNGKDAPYIVNIYIEQNRETIEFIFEFSDGTILRSNNVDLPKTSVRFFGSGSGGSPPVTVTSVSDEAYNQATWDGVLDVAPSKNAVRDIIQTIIGGGGGTVTSVNGYTGVVVLTKSDVGLGNVDNTSDLNKPVSTAQQAAIDGKVSDTAYDATTWNSVVAVAPSKNAVRDIIETILSSIVSLASTVSGLVIDSIADSDTTHAPSRNAVFDALALKAPLASPTLTGTPLAPTASPGTNNTQIASTAYADEKVIDSIADSDTTHAPSRNAVFDALAGKASTNHHATHEANGSDPLNLSKILGVYSVFVDAVNYPTVQAAINYAEALNASWHPLPISGIYPGVAVIVQAGYFDEDLVIRRNISIVGQGRGVTRIKSITSRPPPDITFTGDTTIGSRIVSNVSVDTSTLFVGMQFNAPAFGSTRVLDIIDSATQFRSDFSATSSVVGETFTVSLSAHHQAIINLSIEGDSLTASNETAVGSGIFKYHLELGLTIFGSLIFVLDVKNLSNIKFMNSEIGTPTTLLNVGGEFANSLINQNVTVQVDDTDPGYSAGAGTNVYFDADNIIGAVLYEKPAGATSPTGGLFNCFFNSFSNTGGGGVTVSGHGYDPAVPGNWSPAPSTSHEALDQLAARPTTAPSDAVYDATAWDGVTTIPPSKNAVRDIIETIISSILSLSSTVSGLVIDSIADSDTTHAPSRNAVFDALALKAPLASPTLTGTPLAPTASPGTNNTQIATTAYADEKVIDSIADSDTTHAPSRNAVFDALALKAPLASPALTGNPTAPTQSAHDNTTKIATTAYADALIDDTAYDATTWNGVGFIAASKNAVRDIIETVIASVTSLSSTVSGLVIDSIADADTTHAPSRNAVFDALALKAPLASPTLTGTPLAPTASPGTNNTQIATTAYADEKVIDSIADSDTTHAPSRNAVFDALALKAPLASPTLTGVPLAPTAGAGTNNTQIATTAYSDALVSDIAYDATTWNGVGGIAPSKNAVRDKIDSMDTTIAGLVVDSIADADTTHAPSRNAVFDALALKAPLASPTLTGTPLSPTASPGTNNTQIASTAYADALVSDVAYDATTWNGVGGIAPSKNAVRDKIDSMDTTIAALVVDSIADSDTTHAPSRNAVFDALALKAPLASPTLTGTPLAPTASPGTNNTQIATTAYADEKVIDSIADADTTHAPSRNAVFDALALKAPLASPTLTGTPLAPTAGAGTNNTQIATTAYADALVNDTAYDATTWNSVGGIAPSKNAVRDKIESMINRGTTTIDFGAFPGSSNTSVAVTGQTNILAGSVVNARIWPVATADHTADEHLVETIKIEAGNIVAGTGFTIYGLNTSQINEPNGTGTRLYGVWTVAWSWI